MNILLTNSGRRTYFVKYLFELKDNYNKDIKIFVSETSKNTSSFWVDKRVNKIITPRVEKNNEHYIEVLLKECRKNKINILIPLMDYELHLLALNREKFKSINTTIILSDYITVLNFLHKKKCYEICNDNGILVPKTWYNKNEIRTKKKIVVKKIKGSGSINFHIFKSKRQVPSYFDKSFLYQEFIDGQEYGMDILNDFSGKFLHSCVKKKIEMRSGETDKAEIVYNEKFIKIAKKISSVFRHVGNLDLDFIINKRNQLYFIDFNPRFGGGYPFTHEVGFNYIKAIIKLYKGEKVYFKNGKKKFIGMKGIEIFEKKFKKNSINV